MDKIYKIFIVKEKSFGMVYITKDEAEYLRKTIPDIHIVKTCRLKNKGNRGKRYAEETRSVITALREYRSKD